MTLTVFTPTYNRAHTLERLYRSLCRQTSSDFEWLVIDDGSTDGTKELVEGFVGEGVLKIDYIYKENGGLYTGYNVAYQTITTELSMCVDSDDFLPVDAVEKIIGTWKDKGSSNYAGIVGLDFYAGKDVPIGGYFPEGLKETYFLDLSLKRIHRGDVAMVMRTDLMKSVAPMRGFEGEKNFNPVYMLLRVCDELPLLVVNENLCNVDYQKSDSMSQSIWEQYVDSPRSFARLRTLEMSLKRSTFLNNLRLSAHYTAACLIARDKCWLKNTPCKGLAILTLPAALILYVMIRIKSRKT